MKSAIPWILVVALAAGVYFLYAANNEKSLQLAKMEEQSAELEKLRAENEELKKVPAQNEEVARLRKDNLELLRLRSEAQQLREQNKKISAEAAAAQAKSSQALQAQQQLAGENQALRIESQKAQQAQSGGRITAAQQQANACINNLRVIDGAKQTWALENKKTPDAMPTEADISPYLPGGVQIVCPSGGTYSINAVNVAPTCTIPGHVLK